MVIGAAGSHLGGGDFARLSSEFLLFHAAVIPGLVAWGRYSPTMVQVGGSLLVVGAACFSADLAVLAFAGQHPISGLAPAGGSMLIAGWLTVAVSAFTAVVE